MLAFKNDPYDATVSDILLPFVLLYNFSVINKYFQIPQLLKKYSIKFCASISHISSYKSKEIQIN